MQHQLKIILFLLFIFPCCAFSLNVGDSFQQKHVLLDNISSQAILVTDTSEPALQHKSVAQDHGYKIVFSPVQVTTPSQTFSHVLEIHSGVNDNLICTVTVNAVIAEDGSVTNKLVSTDETKCHTSPKWYDKGFNYDLVVRDGLGFFG